MLWTLLLTALAGTFEDCVDGKPDACEALAADYDGAPERLEAACTQGGKDACELAVRARAGLEPWTDPGSGAAAWQRACSLGDAPACAKLSLLPTVRVDTAALRRWGEDLAGLRTELQSSTARPVRLDVAPGLTYARVQPVIALAAAGVDAVLMRSDPDAAYVLMRTPPTQRAYDKRVARTHELELDGLVDYRRQGPEWYAPLQATRDAYDRCYKRLLYEKSMSGTMVVRLEIVSGAVRTVRLERNDFRDLAAMDSCVVRATKALEFPVAEHIVVLTHQLDFTR